MRNLHKWSALGLLALGFVGLADAGYLAFSHAMGEAPTCSIAGCEIVTTSQYATMAGVPVAYLGVLYYMSIVLLSVLYIDKQPEWLAKWLPIFTIGGFVASIYFVFLQLFIIHAICQYCMLSAVTSTLIFAIGLAEIIRQRRITACESCKVPT